MERIKVNTNSRIEFVDITSEVEAAAGRAGLTDGLCAVFCPHTTAGLTINENADPAVQQDISAVLSKLVPAGRGYTHAEGNADSHVKASVFGSSLTVFVEKGRLVLGTWQGIYLCEADGPRQREVWVKTIPAGKG